MSRSLRAAGWERFRDELLEPAVGEVLARYRIPHDHSLVSFDEIEVIDTWVGDRSSR